MKKLNIIIGLSSGLILFLIIWLTDGLDKLIAQLSKLDLFWVGIAVVCMFLKWFFDSGVIHSIARLVHTKQRFFDSFKVTMIGQFFNSITPFASGGQPAQLYIFMRDGIPAGNAGSILMVKFVIYQSVLTAYSLVIIIFKAAFFQKQVSSFLYVAMVGFLVNVFVISSALLFAKHRALTHKILSMLFSFLKKIHIVKNDDEAEVRFEEQLENFHRNAAMLKNNFALLVQTSILTVLQLTSLFIIPYCIYRSFGLHGMRLTDMIAANAFAFMVSSFIPLPGAAGGAEGGFYLFFSFFFTGQHIMSAIFIWRIVTYYFNIGFGALFTILAPEKPLQRLQEG